MNDIITLDYGSGGKKTSSLIEELILPAFSNPALGELGDGALVEGGERLVLSSDSFVVSPLFFPGGDIGKLSVCGTVNDICMAGGEPKYLTFSLIIEEGMRTDDLKRIIDSAASTAARVGVKIVTGDTKVVDRGRGDGVYINTAGVGLLRAPGLSPKNIREGDAVILSGTAGDHGTAVMLARDSALGGGVESDCAPLNGLCAALWELGDSLRCTRDPTRGGVATTLNEFVEGTRFSVGLNEGDIPVRPSVAAACDMLGLDPLYCACEGRLLAVVAPDAAERAVALLRALPGGENAAVIGSVGALHGGRVAVRTALGGSRILGKLTGAQLPRIC